MFEKTHPPDLFKAHLLASLRVGDLRASKSKVYKNCNVYTAGDEGGMVYVVESGRIKIVVLSPDGKECLIGIHTVGDLFGESYLVCGTYQETATAMEDTILIRIPQSALLQYMSSKQSILSEAVQYLARRITDQQQTILDLMTVNSEHRLGKALLRLGDKLGEKHLSRVRLKHKISHEELSQIVGTTRPRISEFMNKFRELRLIELSDAGLIIINRQKLSDYLAWSSGSSQ